MSLIAVLQSLYDSEINVSISSFWDGGWLVRLGDEMNGYRATETFDNDQLDDAAAWLASAARKAYPQSEFARQFDA